MYKYIFIIFTHRHVRSEHHKMHLYKTFTRALSLIREDGNEERKLALIIELICGGFIISHRF